MTKITLRFILIEQLDESGGVRRSFKYFPRRGYSTAELVAEIKRRFNMSHTRITVVNR